MPLIEKRNEKLNEKLVLGSKGFAYREELKKNAFLHPKDEQAEFP